MFLLDGTWVASATDLVGALRCEYQLLARRAEKAGLVAPLEVERDALMAKAAALGIDHERAELDRLVAALGEGPAGVVAIEQPSTASRAELEAAHAATAQALHGGAQVVYQAAFFDGTFHGLADFVVRAPPDEHGPLRYEPADTKFARHARVEALLQLAAYAWQLEQLGLPVPAQVHLWLGDGSRTHHRYHDLRPVLVERLARMRELLDAPAAVPPWGTDELRWCGWCDHCRAAADARRDVLLVAGVRTDQRRRLVGAGLDTIEALAAADPGAVPDGMQEAVFAKVRAQAVLQAAQDASVSAEHPDGVVRAEVADPAALALLPAPNPGDVFFDFEGDPLHVDDAWDELGLEYLFGVLTHADREDGGAGAAGATTYLPLWAHDRDAERHALEAFIDWLVDRRATPGFERLHVYHYAPYEVTALKKLVQRYGTRADELDQLLKDGVFVDLYGVVRRGVRVSQRSYSIKKLEPLYMGSELRDGDVKDGAESVVVYAEFRALAAAGRHHEAAERLESLRSYNEYDCLSTLRLRDWLLARPGIERAVEGERLATPGAAAAHDRAATANPAHELAERLRAPVVDIPRPERSHEQQGVAMVAAALEYHRREVLPFWWEHFRRVGAPVEDWEQDGEMVVLDPAAIEVLDDWHRPAKAWTRRFAALVDVPGSFKLTAGDRPLFAIWDPPLPANAQQPVNTDRGYTKTVVLEAIEPEDGRCRITVRETLPQKVVELDEGHLGFPRALSADAALEGTAMARAILAIARQHVAPDGTLAAHPALDLLARRSPRLVGGQPLPPADGDVTDAIVAAVEALDRSYLAVQGPPGTGKSTTGARAIARLVRDGWKVGVVAQSHRTVEGFLDKVVDQGIDPAQVRKREAGSGPHRGTPSSDAELLDAACGEAGVLLGGTAWDFVNDKRVPEGSLDLLVVDEAGQFSVADTLAVSRAAPRLLLLGDPQQLSQVSQAIHPEPVNVAALSWVADGHDTLPERFGYFLGRTYRMRPELTGVVSHLSYDGRLDADPCTAHRVLDGVEPGVHTVLVDHREHRASSEEECDAIVELVRDLVGRTWHDPHHDERPHPRPLEPADLVVVAPFNAQVNRLTDRLAEAGYAEVPVGTVDRFQGREAPVAIVSMTASSAAASSRGAGFLLSRHRLNVAISRAQHTAFLVHAPGIGDFVPATPAGLERLGAFLAVSHAGRR